MRRNQCGAAIRILERNAGICDPIQRHAVRQYDAAIPNDRGISVIVPAKDRLRMPDLAHRFKKAVVFISRPRTFVALAADPCDFVAVAALFPQLVRRLKLYQRNMKEYHAFARAILYLRTIPIDLIVVNDIIFEIVFQQLAVVQIINFCWIPPSRLRTVNA